MERTSYPLTPVYLMVSGDTRWHVLVARETWEGEKIVQVQPARACSGRGLTMRQYDHALKRTSEPSLLDVCGRCKALIRTQMAEGLESTHQESAGS